MTGAPAAPDDQGANKVNEIKMAIKSHTDIIPARERARRFAEEIGFPSISVSIIVTAISELTYNVTKYADEGTLHIKEVKAGDKRGMRITVSDKGPGIPDIDQAMQEGYSTSKGLGLGLPGCKRLMDEFEIHSEVGKGTVITMTKWM